jgi:hypothetical protein
MSNSIFEIISALKFRKTSAEAIYNELLAIKEKAESKRIKNLEKKKDNKNTKRPVVTYADIESSSESESDSDDDEDDVQYSCIIIDDFADQLKD